MNDRSERIGDRVRIFLRGSTWYANYQHQGRQVRQSLATGSKKEARLRALRLEADLANGRVVEESPRIELAGLAQEYMTYLESEGRAPKTVSKYRKVFDDFLAVAHERKVYLFAEIDLKLIDAFRKKKADAGQAPKTLFTDTVIVRQLVNFGLSRGYLEKDPLPGLKIRKPKPTPQPCWSVAEVERILEASTGPEHAKFLVLADTGMRVGELRHLTWADVDFDRNWLHIRPKENWKPKTDDQRAVPMTPRVRALLESWPRRCRWVFPARRSSKYPRGDQPFSDRRLLASLKRTLKKLGLPGHLHTFRHAFISQALTRGIPDAVVRQWVGHVDAEILRHYTHIADTVSQEAMQRFSAQIQHTQPQECKEAKNADGK